MDNKIIKQHLQIKELNCKNIESSLKVKNNMLELLGSGTFGVAFLGCLDKLCDKKVTVKFVSMKKKYKLDNNNTHPAYIEGIVGQELSKLVDNNISPHINNRAMFSSMIFSSNHSRNFCCSGILLFLKSFLPRCQSDVCRIFKDIINLNYMKF